MFSAMAWKIVTSVLFTSILGAVFTIKYLSPLIPTTLIVNEDQDLKKDDGQFLSKDQERKDDRKFLLQRNELSRQMNRMSQMLGQKSCEVLKLFDAKPVAHSGGWCEQNISYGHQTDLQLAHAFANFLIGKKVGSFGDGPGHYKAIVEASSLVQLYDAYDGGPYYEEITAGKVKYLDLSIPQYGLPLYEWVISLEVAEHIPQEYEQTYLDNLVRHASEGIILSWAVPGQDGHFHVNNRPFIYVVQTMDGLGFVLSEKETHLLRQSATLNWLRDNTAVFRRKSDAPVDLDNL